MQKPEMRHDRFLILADYHTILGLLICNSCRSGSLLGIRSRFYCVKRITPPLEYNVAIGIEIEGIPKVGRAEVNGLGFPNWSCAAVYNEVPVLLHGCAATSSFPLGIGGPLVEGVVVQDQVAVFLHDKRPGSVGQGFTGVERIPVEERRSCKTREQEERYKRDSSATKMCFPPIFRTAAMWKNQCQRLLFIVGRKAGLHTHEPHDARVCLIYDVYFWSRYLSIA